MRAWGRARPSREPAGTCTWPAATLLPAQATRCWRLARCRLAWGQAARCASNLEPPIWAPPAGCACSPEMLAVGEAPRVGSLCHLAMQLVPARQRPRALLHWPLVMRIAARPAVSRFRAATPPRALGGPSRLEAAEAARLVAMLPLSGGPVPPAGPSRSAPTAHLPPQATSPCLPDLGRCRVMSPLRREQLSQLSAGRAAAFLSAPATLMWGWLEACAWQAAMHTPRTLARAALRS
jgi:hypothetical protein